MNPIFLKLLHFAREYFRGREYTFPFRATHLGAFFLSPLALQLGGRRRGPDPFPLFLRGRCLICLWWYD